MSLRASLRYDQYRLPFKSHATGGSQCGDGSRQHADDNLQDSLPSTFLHFLFFLHLRFNILVNNTRSWLPESHLQLTCKAVETAEFTEGLLSRSLHSNSQLQVCKCKGTKKSWHLQIFYKLFSKIFAIKEKWSLKSREVVPQRRRSSISLSLR